MTLTIEAQKNGQSDKGQTFQEWTHITRHTEVETEKSNLLIH